MSIVNLLNQIKHEEIVLPAIQRDFVWPEERVLRLLDSIMRGYPIGIALLWETYFDLQYRKFDEAFREGQVHDFKEKQEKTEAQARSGWSAAFAIALHCPIWHIRRKVAVF